MVRWKSNIFRKYKIGRLSNSKTHFHNFLKVGGDSALSKEDEYRAVARNLEEDEEVIIISSDEEFEVEGPIPLKKQHRDDGC